MAIYLHVNRVPSAYQEVEYIESSGTQYINLGWTPSSNYCRIEADITPYSGNSQWSVFWGMIDSSSTGYSLHTNRSTWYANLGSSNNINFGVTFNSGTRLNLDFTVDSGSRSLSLNGSTTTGSYNGSIVQSTRPFYLFAYNESGSTTWKATMRVYSFKIYSAASTLVRDLVPCYRKSDSVIGLYDTVNDVFYTNDGTGTFTKGSDVYPEQEVKKMYIGEYVGPRTPGANTLAYYPLTSATTTSDESGNGNTLTNSNVTFGTYQGVSCASFNGSSSKLGSTIAQTPQGAAVRTVLWYCYNNHATYTEGTDEIIFVSGQTGSTGKMFKVAVYNDKNCIQQRGDDHEFGQTIREQRWCGAVVYDGTKFTFYVNGVSQGDWTNTPVTSGTSFYIGGSNTVWWRWSGYISNVIFENKAWTAQEVQDYYNLTKSDYGIS